MPVAFDLGPTIRRPVKHPPKPPRNPFLTQQVRR